MGHCQHTQWLGLGLEGNKACLQLSDRLQNLCDRNLDSYAQQPSLFVFIGGEAKSVALRQLFHVKTGGTQRKLGEVHLHTDASSTFHEGTILIAEGDIPTEVQRGKGFTNKCHEITRQTIRNRTLGINNLGQIAKDVYSTLLFPFTNVFCLFSEDLGGLEYVARHVSAWMEHGTPSALPRATLPKMFIVTKSETSGIKCEEESTNTFLRLLKEATDQDLSNWFSSIEVVALLPNDTISDQVGHSFLRERLMNACDLVRNHRLEERMLFSMTHFIAYLQSACKHFSDNNSKPFDFIIASRDSNPVATDLDEHLNNIINQMKTPRNLIDFAAPIIASSLLLDNYRAADHEAFPPDKVFNALYKQYFLRIDKGHVLSFEDSKDVMLRSGFISLVEKYFGQFFQDFIQNGTPASQIHHENFRRFDAPSYRIESNNKCLFCIRRHHPCVLQCSHMVCEHCVTVFRECHIDDSRILRIGKYFICDIGEDVALKDQPQTASAEVLCVGRGVRGIAALESIKQLHSRTGLSVPFQKFFRVVLAMLINGWSIHETTDAFEKLTKLASQARKLFDIPLFPRKLKALISYCADGICDPAFQELIKQLSNLMAQFCLDERAFAVVNDNSRMDREMSFRGIVELDKAETVEKLVQARELNTFFERSDHRKRQAFSPLDTPTKRHRYI